MIEVPRRPVTRFFIPLIDVLTLLFCIFLLMPVVRPADESAEGASPAAEVERLRKEKMELLAQLGQSPEEKRKALEEHLAVRVLEIDGDSGKLFYYDPRRTTDRRFEVTRDNVRALIDAMKREARGEDVYFLLMYPRPAAGYPRFPLQEQKEEYEHWFAGVPHGYDIPRRAS